MIDAATPTIAATSTLAMTCGIAALATFGVIVRPWRIPEFVWALAGAALLVLLQLLPWRAALAAAAKGLDVYFFLVGMMLLAEAAREQGLFDWLAAEAVKHARGSTRRLFLIVYSVGTVVTVLMSNDATAVVLTPAVYAAAMAARVEPLPHLLVCAFIANAASFVLPISNPANLVVFGAHMPPLMDWLRQFTLPSVLAIIATYIALRFTQRDALRGSVATKVAAPTLGRGGALAALGIAVTAIVLIAASATGHDLGLPTFIAGIGVVVAVVLATGQSLRPIVTGIAWSVLPLVAGLFILVEGLNATGVVPALARLLGTAAAAAPAATAWASGLGAAFGSNLINNLPMGLIAATVANGVELPAKVMRALLIGVDLGPNLSVTGSLATILWLIALRREGEHISALRFLKLGCVVMPPALVLALAAAVFAGP